MTRWKTSKFVTAVALIGLVACGGGEPDMEETGMDAAPEVPATPAPDAAAGDDMAAPADLPEGVTPEMVALGQQVFSGQAGGGTCNSCHGPNATGTPLGPDLTDDAWLNISGRNYDEIVELIKTGVQNPVEAPSAMPPMGGASLSDEHVNAAAAYVVSLGNG